MNTNERPTPETDAKWHAGHFVSESMARGYAEKLERERDEARDHVTRLCGGIATALTYPRGSEAQVRCLEEIGQDAAYILKNLNP